MSIPTKKLILKLIFLLLLIPLLTAEGCIQGGCLPKYESPKKKKKVDSKPKHNVIQKSSSKNVQPKEEKVESDVTLPTDTSTQSESDGMGSNEPDSSQQTTNKNNSASDQDLITKPPVENEAPKKKKGFFSWVKEKLGVDKTNQEQPKYNSNEVTVYEKIVDDMIKR